MEESGGGNMAENANTDHFDKIVRNIYGKADSLYKFVDLYSALMAKKNDYGDGQLMTMVEVHLLTKIEENPGITVTELAKANNRTKGAISQKLKKLIEWGYIVGQKKDGNAKSILLYATEKGIKCSTKHKHYDLIDIMQTTSQLLQTCSVEELDTFYKVIAEYTKLLEE